MSDETEEKPNVFSLSGEPYDPPEEGLATADPETIKTAEEILSYAKANQIRGILAIGWSPQHQRFVRWLMVPKEEEPHGAALRYIGGIEVIKTDLISLTLDQVFIIDDDGNPME